MPNQRIALCTLATLALLAPVGAAAQEQPRTQGCYGVMQFDAHPTSPERDELRREGVEILSHFRDNQYRVRLRSCSTEVPESSGGLIRLDARDRVAADIWAGRYDAYRVVLPDSTVVNPVLNADGTLTLTVAFYRTVSDAEMQAVLAAVDGGAVRESDTRWVVTLPRESLHTLAQAEIVEWIDAGPRPATPEVEVTRRVLEVDAVQHFDETVGGGTGVLGRGVVVGVFDQGIDEGHPDFAGRIPHSMNLFSGHGTHVAGIILGGGQHSGEASEWGIPNGGRRFQYRGIAPEALLLEGSKRETDVTEAYMQYIQSGMLLSNHSYSLQPDGDYDLANRTRDRQIRGDEEGVRGRVPPRLQIYSAGNHGEVPLNGGNQVGYFSLTKQVKNALVVGNYVPDSLRVSRSSSLGPTYDGRIKPDVVAPGSGVLAAGFCSYNDRSDPLRKECKNDAGAAIHRNYYRRYSGTSMAAPAVAGVVALVLEQYSRTYGVDLTRELPLPSTLRAIVIHTAEDVVSNGAWFDNEDGPVMAFRGPDFATGWGLVNARKAVQLVERREILEGLVESTCDSLPEFFVDVAGGAPLRVTLAWDDPGGELARRDRRVPLLVNDLDLVLIDPRGKVHRPWLLDQVAYMDGNPVDDDAQRCNTALDIRQTVVPAPDAYFFRVRHSLNRNDPISPTALQEARTGRDHLNNVEQVFVENPQPGRWRVRVIGFNVPDAPQRFSVVGATFVRP